MITEIRNQKNTSRHPDPAEAGEGSLSRIVKTRFFAQLRMTATGLILTVFVFLIPAFAAAKTEFFVSWQTNSYAPPSYQGKILPSPNSKVLASFELISNGQPADLSSKLVRWYLDNELYQTGFDLKTISFQVDKLHKNNYQVKISLPKFNGGNDLEKFFTIPVATPEIVIDAPYYQNIISPGLNFFRALLYFFNPQKITDLNLEWSADGQLIPVTSGAPDILKLQTPTSTSGSIISLNVSAKNLSDEFEYASEKINLNVK